MRFLRYFLLGILQESLEKALEKSQEDFLLKSLKESQGRFVNESLVKPLEHLWQECQEKSPQAFVAEFHQIFLNGILQTICLAFLRRIFIGNPLEMSFWDVCKSYFYDIS